MASGGLVGIPRGSSNLVEFESITEDDRSLILEETHDGNGIYGPLDSPGGGIYKAEFQWCLKGQPKIGCVGWSLQGFLN